MKDDSPTFKHDVFLSHSSADKEVVRDLAKKLRNDGMRVWFDEWEIRPGDLISLQIEHALEQSRTLVLIMSRHAFSSEWVTCTIVVPARLSWQNSSMISRACVECRLPVGSSANKSAGACTTARAMPTSCCCPPESWLG